jgi:MFS family permease
VKLTHRTTGNNDASPTRCYESAVQANQSGGVRDALVTRPFVLLVLAHFLQALGYASMLLLPLYLQHLGASRTEIGTLMATSAIAGLLTRPAVGWALDTLGRRSTVIAGTIMTTLAMVLIWPVTSIGAAIYIERVVFGVGVGALFTGYFTFAADIIPASRRTEGLALFGVSGLLPLLINPFADRIGIAPPDLRWFLPAVGGVIALSMLPLLFLKEPRAVKTEPKSMRQALGALRKRALWPVWWASVVFAAMVALFMTFATVAAEGRGVETPATLWLSYAAGAVCVRIFGGRLPDRVGPSNLVAPALGFYIAAMLLAAEATSMRDFLFAALLAGIGHGYCFPVLTGQVVSRSPEVVRGSALAVFTALWGFSELLVSPAFGAIADRYGDGAMFMTAAGMGIVSLVLWVVLEHRFGELSNTAT